MMWKAKCCSLIWPCGQCPWSAFRPSSSCWQTPWAACHYQMLCWTALQLHPKHLQNGPPKNMNKSYFNTETILLVWTTFFQNVDQVQQRICGLTVVCLRGPVWEQYWRWWAGQTWDLRSGLCQLEHRQWCCVHQRQQARGQQSPSGTFQWTGRHSGAI